MTEKRNETDDKFRHKLGRTKLGIVAGIALIGYRETVSVEYIWPVAMVAAAYVLGQSLVDYQKEKNKA